MSDHLEKRSPGAGTGTGAETGNTLALGAEVITEGAAHREREGLLAIQAFLERLHPGGPYHVSSKKPDGAFRGGVHRDLPDAAKWALRENASADAYMSIAALRPGWSGAKAKKGDVDSVGWLWVDINPRAGEPLDEERVRIRGLLTDKLPQGVPAPTLIVDSGRGMWGLWQLSSPIAMPAVTDPAWPEAVASIEERCYALELAFGADDCHNVDRVMRLAGTANRKPGAGVARLVADSGESFQLEMFRRQPLGSAAPKQVAPEVAWDKLPRWESPSDIPRLSDRIRAVIANGDDPDSPYPSRSEALFAVMCEMVRAGFTDSEIAGVVTDPSFEVSAHLYDPKGRKLRPGDRRMTAKVMKAVAAQIKNARAKAGAAEAGDDFIRDKGGNPYSNSQHNIRVALRRLGVALRHDLLAGRALVEGLDGCGPNLDDEAMNRLWLVIDERFGFLPKYEFFDRVLSDHARRWAFHPVVDYLDGLTWDGVPRLGRWLATYGSADDTRYVRAVGELVLVAAVRRVRRPGVKFDEMMVLESPQGTNKSTALKVLAGGDDWFTDDLPLNADGKRVIEALAGKWIVEAGELKGMRKGGADHLKGFLSRTHDRGRLSYDRREREVPRQCVFVGTTNDSRYLRDTTGNRRFWPVKVDGFNIDALRRDRDQLWAEAAAREAEGASIRLDPELWADAAAEQDARRVEDPFYERLHSVLGEEMEGKLRAEDAWRIVGKPAGMRTQDDNERLGDAMRRLGDAMRRLGFDRPQLRFGGKPEWCYARGDRRQRIVPKFDPNGELDGVATTDGGPGEPF